MVGVAAQAVVTLSAVAERRIFVCVAPVASRTVAPPTIVKRAMSSGSSSGSRSCSSPSPSGRGGGRRQSPSGCRATDLETFMEAVLGPDEGIANQLNRQPLGPVGAPLRAWLRRVAAHTPGPDMMRDLYRADLTCDDATYIEELKEKYANCKPHERVRLIVCLWYNWPGAAFQLRKAISQEQVALRRKRAYDEQRETINAKRRQRYANRKWLGQFQTDLRSKLAAIPLMIEDGTP